MNRRVEEMSRQDPRKWWFKKEKVGEISEQRDSLYSLSAWSYTVPQRGFHRVGLNPNHFRVV